MDEQVERLKYAVRAALGDAASRTLLYHLDQTFDVAAKNRVSLLEACTKVEKMVGLYIGKDEASAVAERCKAVLRTAAPPSQSARAAS